MSYCLENQNEAARLEYQSLHPAYRVQEELDFLNLPCNSRILDAGCGSGLLSRYLTQEFGMINVEACDFSELRIRQAQDLSAKAGVLPIRFFSSPLEYLPRPEMYYDGIICRYVFEHLKDPHCVAQELLRVLKPGGQILIIDFDGVIFDLYTENTELRPLLKEVQERFPFDRYIGRKLPCILKNSGFEQIQWKVQSHSFQGEDLNLERQLNEERFAMIRPELANLLGVERAHRFIDLFLAEMMIPENVLFYSKFVVSARRPGTDTNLLSDGTTTRETPT